VADSSVGESGLTGHYLAILTLPPIPPVDLGGYDMRTAGTIALSYHSWEDGIVPPMVRSFWMQKVKA
jgi:hypothetical protein